MNGKTYIQVGTMIGDDSYLTVCSTAAHVGEALCTMDFATSMCYVDLPIRSGVSFI